MRMWSAVAFGLALACLVPAAGASRSRSLEPASTFASGERILYASDWSGRMQIYAVDPARPAATAQLTFGGAGFLDPLPSPDGRRLAYRSSSSFLWERSRDLWVARADGSAPKRIATGSVTRVVWSPDSRLAYITDQKVHLVRADGSGDRIVPGTPSWMRTAGSSPDGKWSAAPVLRNGRIVAIEVVPAAGGPPRVFEATSVPTWSPDSRRLAFTRADGTHLATVPGGRVRRLTRRVGIELTWSPDGRSLAFREGRDGPEPTSAYTSISGDLVLVTLTGRTRTIVDADRAYGGRILGPVWTRPPKSIRYRAPKAMPRTRVAAQGLLAGGSISRLAADGSRVAFVACEGVFAWTPATGDVTAVRASEPLSVCHLQDRFWVGYSLALAGDRLAYGELQGCHTINVTLRLEQLAPSRASSELARGRGQCGNAYRPGAGWLAGAGDLLVFSSWDESCSFPPGCGSTSYTTTNQRIHRAEGGCPCPTIASSPGPLIPADVDGGHVVAYGENETWILDREGKRLLTIPVSPRAAQLSGSDLVLVVRSELRLYDAASGALRRTWPLRDVAVGARCELRCAPAGETPRLLLEDLFPGLVAYVLDGEVHVLRLRDGADAVVARGTHARFLDAGLVYADGSRLHLVPFDRLPMRR